eukprot:scaffold82747_cov28-Tisochrysis_lutea.AAC.2
MVADLVPRLHEHRVVAAAALLHELNYLGPIPDVRAHLKRQVAPIKLAVDLVRLIELREVGSNLGRLLLGVIEQPQPLDEVYAHVVLGVHKRLVRHPKVQLLQRCLGHQPPEARMGVGLNEAEGISQR